MSKIEARGVQVADARPGSARRGRPRDAAARGRVVAVAADLFLRQGFLSTTMDEIARGAGVSIQTIYSGFGSKVGLLTAAHDIALAGDDEAVPLLRRPWFDALSAAPTAAEAWTSAVPFLTQSTVRVAPVYSMILAAEADSVVSEVLSLLRRQRLDQSRQVARQVLRRPGAEEVDSRRLADVIYAVESVESFALFVTQRGWSQARWRAWVHDTVAREFSSGAGPGGGS